VRLDELRGELDGGRIRPAYLLGGTEPLLRDDALALLRQVVLAGAPEDFNLQRMRGGEATPAELQDAVRTLPVLARRRLVVLSDLDQARGAAGKALLESLAVVVAELLDQESCVLAVGAAKLDRRSRWVKAFAEPAAMVDCEPPRNARALAAFIREEAERQAVELDGGVAELLAERVGPQLLVLRQELAKAGLFAGEGEVVTRAMVEAATSDLAEQPIWDLTDAIGQGRSAEALALLARIQGAGAPAPVILGTLASHFRKLARLRSGGTVPGPPFVVRKLESQARRYPPPRLLACLGAIHQTDAAIKGAGALPPELALERLVMNLSS
jgi:DNA polymerase-3 subunit delta